MVENKRGFYEQIWRSFIRPPRFNYSISDLGPLIFEIDGIPVRREDFDVYNKRYQRLRCSIFERAASSKKIEGQEAFKPCVVYLHCNAGCRVESLPYLDFLIPRNISVCTFDFGGCGMSDGEFISLGVHEVEDVEIVIQFIKKFKGVTHVGLWGRSMGAVTSLRYAAGHRDLVGIITDSPFSNLRKLAIELSKDRINLPSFLVSGLLAFIKSTIKSKAHFDIKELDVIKSASEIYVTPGFFITSKEDTFVKAHHTEKLYEAYRGPKKIRYVPGNHNEHRTDDILNEGAEWMAGCFKKYSSTHVFKFEIPKEYQKDHISQIHSREKRKTIDKPQESPLQKLGFSPYTDPALKNQGFNYSAERNRGKSVENYEDDEFNFDDTDDDTEDSVEKGVTRRSSSFLTPSYSNKHKEKALEERKNKLASEGRSLKSDQLDEYFDYKKHPDHAKNHSELISQLSNSSPLYIIPCQTEFQNHRDAQMTPQKGTPHSTQHTPFKKKSPEMEIKTFEENLPANPQILTTKNKDMAAQNFIGTPSPRHQQDFVNSVDNRTPISVRAAQSSARKKIFEDPRPMAPVTKITLIGHSGSPKEEGATTYCKNKFAFKNKIPDNNQIRQREIQQSHYYSPNTSKLPNSNDSKSNKDVPDSGKINLSPSVKEEVKGIRLVQPDFINKKGLLADNRLDDWASKTPEKSPKLADDEKIKNVLKEYKANTLLKEMYSE